MANRSPKPSHTTEPKANGHTTSAQPKANGNSTAETPAKTQIASEIKPAEAKNLPPVKTHAAPESNEAGVAMPKGVRHIQRQEKKATAPSSGKPASRANWPAEPVANGAVNSPFEPTTTTTKASVSSQPVQLVVASEKLPATEATAAVFDSQSLLYVAESIRAHGKDVRQGAIFIAGAAAACVAASIFVMRYSKSPFSYQEADMQLPGHLRTFEFTAAQPVVDEKSCNLTRTSHLITLMYETARFPHT
eukprot:scaffold523091_cov46-Prasinocladus_malaysianus.AAC.3